MAAYKCSFVDQMGNRHKIKYNAESKTEVVEYLEQSNYTIISIDKYRNSIDMSEVFIQRITSKDLAVFCKQLHAMLRAGVTIVSSLDILRQQTENKRLVRIIDKLYEELQKGNTLSEALYKHNDAFPPIFISMIEAGELSGNIDLIMDRLAVHFEKEYKIENKIKSAMAYPAILAIVCVVVVVFLLTTIMPTFVEMYSSSGVELPVFTTMLINFSNVLRQYWYLFMLSMLVIILGMSMLMKNLNVKYKEDYYKLKIPVVKNLTLKVATSRFTRTLSTLMGSGVQLLQALDTVAGVTGNRYIGSKVIEAKEDVRKGMSLSQTLRQQGVFPPMVYFMIKIGEDSGSIEEILDKTADFYDEEVDAAVQRLTTMLEPIMIVIMAVIIGFIVIAMVTPMFDMVKTVQ